MLRKIINFFAPKDSAVPVALWQNGIYVSELVTRAPERAY